MTVTYDPRQDPRYLGLSEEEQRELEADRFDLTQKLLNLNEAKEVLQTESWRRFALQTETRLKDATDQLVGGCETTREEDELRGRIKALQEVLDYPATLDSDIESTQHELDQLSEQPS